MRVIALLAVFNEERFIGPCLDHLIANGLEVYLIDNSSTDQTVTIAERYQRRGVIGIEVAPRQDSYSWRPLLARKEELAATLDSDWFLHVDADEFRLPPRTGMTLSEALTDVDHGGYSAVNFLEFTFVPTRESPHHDHPDFQRTMRWYYPLVPPLFPNRLNAWKRQDGPVDLTSSGGHQVRFPGLRMYPISLPMRHYLFLSVEHAIRKYVERTYDPEEVRGGWHRARASLRREMIVLPSQAELRTYVSDDRLNPSNPRSQHDLFAGTGAVWQGSH